MEEQTAFCETCYEIAYEIESYHQFRTARFAYGEKLSNFPGRREAPREIPLGAWKDLQGRLECTSCQDIASALIHAGKEPSAHAGLVFESDRKQGLWIRGTSWLDETCSQIWRLESPNPAHEVRRPFNSQQFNINLIQQWVNCCDAPHGSHCHTTELSSPLRQIYLIDVQMGCHVSAVITTRYLALSYVWGEVDTIQTTKSNLPYLQKPGSINANNVSLMLPKTIKDALRLASLLGEKYLWVDRLCIVQDEKDTKQACLNAMGSIYSNASFTIVAADGHNADRGLRGVVYGSENRANSCDTVRFPCETNVLIHRPRAWDPEDSPWASRAWTFQEALFSRRLLMFNGKISWFCRAATWQEHVSGPTEDELYVITHGPHEVELHLAARNAAWPDLERWANLVEEYNKRKLTFDRDVIDAFAAVSSVFNSCFSGGLLWGIPEMFFDHCLVWRPRGVLRRRVYNHAYSKIPFPSWSWVAWEGDIMLVGAPPILYDRINDLSIKIQPLFQWYKSREPASTLFPVENIYSSLQLGHDKSQPEQIPTGWNQKQYSNGTFYYIHETVPKVRFRYPIPMVNEKANPLSNENGRYLHFKSQRARLFLGRELENIRDNWTTFPACLVDDEGKWAGTIRSNTSRSDRLSPGLCHELIALSLGKAVNDRDYSGILDGWKIPERPQDSEFYEFYYVMWIEWERGIAYRKAIGTVYKPMWERQIREDINVILG